jgi:DNA mismatch repair protein MutL
MGRILKLPDDLANQIAAGEVVERPASVVKELIENALDAGATRIAVTIEYGGKKLVRVEDDGDGMDAGDARLCLERHATSKIHRLDDLAAIGTLGFRGEAVPSIASVSRFRLRTRARGSSIGTETRAAGGSIESVVEAGSPEGTMVEVADLFYNVPARRKFLKSDAAEAAHVARLVTQLALGYPEVGFTLVSAGRTLLDSPPVSGLAERLYQVYGDRQDLVRVERATLAMAVHGFVAALAEQGPTRGPQHVFVNRRIVKDRTIAHAIIDAYSVAANRERSPEVHLFLELPPDRVDVNVHPTKAEVRFRDQSLVHELVRHALGDALGRGPAPALTLAAPEVPAAGPIQSAIPGALAGGVYTSRWVPHGAGRTPVMNPREEPSGGPSVTNLRPLIPLGQFRDTFIIAIDDEGIAIVDQHVAHERVLFERIMQRLNDRGLESQRLLVPMTLELPAAERQALLARAGELSRFGFQIEDFGGSAIAVTAVPSLLPADACDAALRALADDLEGLDRGLRVEEALKRIAATTACHAAVKANYPLTMEKMQHVLDELRATAYSTVCPHGRPVMLRLTRREVEKNFERA